MQYLFILVSVFFLASCGGSSTAGSGVQVNQGTPIPVDAGFPSVGASSPNGSNGSYSPRGGGGGGGAMPLEEESFDLAIKDGKGILDFTIKSGSRALIKFDGESGKELSANLIGISGDVAGYRFAQILFPDGRSDGPFERNVVYTLSSTGKHGLRITPDIRGGSAGGGKLRVEILLK